MKSEVGMNVLIACEFSGIVREEKIEYTNFRHQRIDGKKDQEHIKV